jgi:hypothetical protein
MKVCKHFISNKNTGQRARFNKTEKILLYLKKNSYTEHDQGSMLWSQFSAIFDNFRQKIGVFLKNQCYDHNFCKN